MHGPVETTQPKTQHSVTSIVVGIEGHLVVRYECADHGLVGFNLVGTKVHCRTCGCQVFGSFADLIFAITDEIDAMASGHPEQGAAQ